MISKKNPFLIAFPFILLACSTNPPTSYYQLQSIASITKNQQSITQKTSILINPIKFPEYLDRPQLVTRINDYKFQLAENHQWAEPLENEFTRIFIENINKKITANQSVIFLNPKNTLADITVDLEVMQLDVNTDDQAVLEVKWEYWRNDNVANKVVLIKTFKFTAKNKSYESRVEAQSQAISQLSDYVVGTLSALF